VGWLLDVSPSLFHASKHTWIFKSSCLAPSLTLF
jgi:hypothetical protein